MDRSTRYSSDIRVCSSIIDAILITLPSVVESNWKSIAHNTFGAFASTTGPEDTPAAHENCGTASKFIDRCLTS